MARRGIHPLWFAGGLLLAGALAFVLLDAGRTRRTTPVALEPASPSEAAPAPRMDLQPTLRPEPAAPERPLGATVTGRLVTPDHRVVPAGRVELREGNPLGLAGVMHLPRLGSHRAEVDAFGYFALVEVPPTSQLVVYLEGETFAPRNAGPYTVAAGELIDLGDLVVSPGLLVHGTVLGPAGERVQGARVALSGAFVRNGVGPGTPDPLYVVLTDKDGRYEIRHVPHMLFNLVISAEGYASAVAEQSILPDRSLVQLVFDLQLERPEPLLGTVVDAKTDAPLAGLEVFAQPFLIGQGPGFARSDKEGAFTFENLLPGRYNVWTDAPGYGRRGQIVTVEDWHAGVHLRLQPAARIVGHVVDPEGEPILNFDLQTLRAAHKRTPGGPVGPFQRFRTNDGRFEIEDLEAGWYSFEVWARNYPISRSQEAVRVEIGEVFTGVVLTLQPSASLAGRLLDDLEQPIAGAAVSLHANQLSAVDFLRGGEPPAAWMRTTHTDHEGRFELRDVTEFVYQVRFDHSVYPVLLRNDVAVRAGRRTDLGDVEIPRAATLRGVVVDASGRPQADARVSLSGPLGEFAAQRAVRTNGAGHYLIDRLAPGSYLLRAIPAQPTLAEAQNLVQAEIQRVLAMRAGQAESPLILHAGQAADQPIRLE